MAVRLAPAAAWSAKAQVKRLSGASGAGHIDGSEVAVAQTPAKQQLADALKALHEAAGRPALADVGRRAAEFNNSEILSKSSISDWMSGKSVPTGKRLASLVYALAIWPENRSRQPYKSPEAGREVARIERLRVSAENDKKASGIEKSPALGRPIESWSPFELEVHRPIVVQGAPTALPEYLKRGHDEELARLLKLSGPELIVLVGGSSTGKTRACFEALATLPQGWRLHHPLFPSKPESLIEVLRSGRIPPRSVLWLNELQDYLNGPHGEVAAAALREFMPGKEQVIALGTMWPDRWQDIVNPNSGSAISRPHARALLNNIAVRVDVDLEFSERTLGELAGRDSRIKLAIEAEGGRITQYLAAGPALLELFGDSKESDPATWAVLCAAMDWCIVGDSTDAESDFLREAAPGYLPDEQWGRLAEDWFPVALGRASELLKGATSPLSKVRPNGARSDVYRLADYLLQFARQTRSQGALPDSFWEGAWSVLESGGTTFRRTHKQPRIAGYIKRQLSYGVARQSKDFRMR